MVLKRVSVFLFIAIVLWGPSVGFFAGDGRADSNTGGLVAAQTPFPRSVNSECALLFDLCTLGNDQDITGIASGQIMLNVGEPRNGTATFQIQTMSPAGAVHTAAGDFLIQFRQDPNRASLGQITQLPNGFSANINSFFDVFVEIDLGGGRFERLMTDGPIPLVAQFSTLCGARFTLPPPDPPCGPRLIDTRGRVVGSIRRMVLHICQPLAFSVAPGGPSELDPANIYVPGPSVLITKEELGLTRGDDIDALSAGRDFLLSRFRYFPRFSVDRTSMGVFGSAVRVESACSPAEAHGDEFGLKPFGPTDSPCTGSGPNYLCYDENGALGCLSAPGLGLRISDDVDAIDEWLPMLGRGEPVYFSLAPGSPTLAALGASPADILVSSVGGTPSIYATAADLRLSRTDNLDALCLTESGDRKYAPTADPVRFSLGPGSPSLSIVFGPADILGRGPVLDTSALSLGLLARDNLNALKCRAQP